MTDLLLFQILGIRIGVQCTDAELRALVQASWARMSTHEGRSDTIYSVARVDAPPAISIIRPGRPPLMSANAGQFLYQLERDVTIELQERRKDLFFTHAGAAEFEGDAFLFVAESGQGKSTTVWALLHHGFGYLSDELAPIDLSSLQVLACPRALSLKPPVRLPLSYGLPAETVATSRTLHVPVQYLPRIASGESFPLAAMFFVNYRPHASAPTLQPISPGEASARLYRNALNPLAHPNAGLDAAIHVAKSIPSFVLESADLASTCALICSTLDAVRHAQPS